MSFIVIVGNIGTVYDGHERRVANEAFNEYKGQSKTGYGRASGEQVVLLCEGEILREYFPPLDENGNPLPPKKLKDRPKKIIASMAQLEEIAAGLVLSWERAANHQKPSFEETNKIRAAMIQAQKILSLNRRP